MKRLWSLLTASLLVLSAIASAPAEGTQHGALVDIIAGEAAEYIITQDADRNMYQDLDPDTPADGASLPAAFDLRDRGVVPAVRNQGNFGTCWGFSTIAASEISLLSSLGITAEEYEALAGEELRLSEKHLAWFGASHLPTL